MWYTSQRFYHLLNRMTLLNKQQQPQPADLETSAQIYCSYSLTWHSLRRARGSRRGWRKGVTVWVWRVDLNTEVFVLISYPHCNPLHLLYRKHSIKGFQWKCYMYYYLQMPELFQFHLLNSQVLPHDWLKWGKSTKFFNKGLQYVQKWFKHVTLWHETIKRTPDTENSTYLRVYP